MNKTLVVKLLFVVMLAFLLHPAPAQAASLSCNSSPDCEPWPYAGCTGGEFGTSCILGSTSPTYYCNAYCCGCNYGCSYIEISQCIEGWYLCTCNID